MDQQMKIDAEKLRLARETRGWSQEHLATVAGLSVRTLQRMEADGSASAESRMAVAAALGLDAASLCASATPAPAGGPANTRSMASRRKRWQIHLALYVLVCGALLLANLLSSASPNWAIWPALGWGLGLVLHSVRVHRRSRPAPPVGE